MNPEPAPLDDILDDLFHGCAFAAYVRLSVESGKPPGTGGDPFACLPAL